MRPGREAPEYRLYRRDEKGNVVASMRPGREAPEYLSLISIRFVG